MHPRYAFSIGVLLAVTALEGCCTGQDNDEVFESITATEINDPMVFAIARDHYPAWEPFHIDVEIAMGPKYRYRAADWVFYLRIWPVHDKAGQDTFTFRLKKDEIVGKEGIHVGRAEVPGLAPGTYSYIVGSATTEMWRRAGRGSQTGAMRFRVEE